MAALVVFAAGLASPESAVAASAATASGVRSYQVRVDAKTGRLVRVPVRRKARSAQRRGKNADQGSPLVQGSREPASAPVHLRTLIVETARRYDIEPEWVLAIVRQESNFNPFAVSVKGAKGLMQLMPATAERFGVNDIFDPAENVHGGIQYLRFLLDRYEGNRELVLAAYNAGEGAVDRYDGIPPYAETQDYVERVEERHRRASNAADLAPEETEPRVRIIARKDPSGALRFETMRD